MSTRIRRAAVVGVCLVTAWSLVPVTVAGAATVAPTDPGQSVAYQIDATHSGFLRSGGPVAPLARQWSVPMGGAVGYPLIAGGRVFVTVADQPGYGSSLHALDGVTGANAWGPIPLGGTYYFSAITYGMGEVYAVNYDGVVSAFDAATGELRWKYSIGFNVTSPPTYANGVVYVGANRVVAISARTGRVLWMSNFVLFGDHSAPAVTADGVYVSYSCENVYKFDPVTGATIWTSSGGCSGGGGKTPVVTGGKVWVRDGGPNKPTAFDAATGASRLTFASLTAPTFDDTLGYFIEGSELVARDPETQQPAWTFSGDPQLTSAPIVVGNQVYVGSATGMLYAVDRATGLPVWSDNVGAAIPAPDEQDAYQLTGLAAGNGLVVVPASHLLVAYRSASGVPAVGPATATTSVAFGAGWNPLGQLGDGSLLNRLTGVKLNTSVGFQAVTAGTYHSLGLAADGTVRAWGWNGAGQLGDGTTTDRHSPAVVPGLSGVVAVSAGAYHSLALESDGTVWGWGWNVAGQLGDGTTTDRHAPVKVAGLSGVVAISAGGYHSLALKSDGTVWAWGWNPLGQLGDGTTVDRWLPVQVAGLSGVVSIDAGMFHNLAARSDGTVAAWGWNALAQLGDGTTTDRHAPVTVSGLANAVSVSAGEYHSLALVDDGTVSAWGWNGLGLLGDGTTTSRLLPGPVSGLHGVVAIDAGPLHSLAATESGAVDAWGWNGVGQLGDGTTLTRLVPVALNGVFGATAVAAGLADTIAA